MAPPINVPAMHALYVLSLWLHVVAATAWLGSMFFLSVVLVPWMRRGNRAEGARLLRETGPRLRVAGWICFGVFLVTGVLQMHVRGMSLSDFASAEWLRSPAGRRMSEKLVLFAVIVSMSLYHDLVVGPSAVRAMTDDPSGGSAERLRRQASWLGRITMIFALVMIYLGVRLSRG